MELLFVELLFHPQCVLLWDRFQICSLFYINCQIYCNKIENKNQIFYCGLKKNTEQKLEDLGFFSEKEGWQRVLLDALEVINYLKKHNRCKKLFLFGRTDYFWTTSQM